MQTGAMVGLGPRQRRWWRILFRIAAVGIGLVPLLASELVLRAFDLGHPDRHADPFVGFTAVQPLFVLDQTSRRYEVPRARQLCFRPQSFPTRKAPDTFRIFCLGGSTVQGRPFAVETSFTTWLRLSLEAADPSRRWEVVNCGGVSYASYRLVPILEEVLHYQPDLIVLYTGHNEFLEDRTYSTLERLPGPVRGLLGAASRLRTFVVLREGLDRLAVAPVTQVDQDRAILPAEVDALLDYKGGLESYHRDAAWRQGVIDHYTYNLGRMVATAREAGVPVLLANPVSNLETPPFKSQHRDGLTDAERLLFDAYWNAARARYDNAMGSAVEYLTRALDIDDRHAGLWYTLGTCLMNLDQLDEARAALRRARDEDICPLRILGPMNAVVLEIARETDTPLVDVQKLFADRSPGGITGDAWLVDHVHPSIVGHQLIAEALHAEMVRQGWARPRARLDGDPRPAVRRESGRTRRLLLPQGGATAEEPARLGRRPRNEVAVDGLGRQRCDESPPR